MTAFADGGALEIELIGTNQERYERDMALMGKKPKRVRQRK